MAIPTPKTKQSLYRDFILTVRRLSDRATYYGSNSVLGAIGLAAAGLAARGYLLFTALKRRYTLQSASGDALVEVAAERGAVQLLTQRAKTWAVITPLSSTVTALTIGASDLIEVADGDYAAWLALVGGDLRISSQAGSVTETATIIAVTTGTGPNGGAEVEVASLAGSFSPLTEVVTILARVTMPSGTSISSSAGVGFTTVSPVTTSDNNPVLRGLSDSLLLADIVELRAAVGGIGGNVAGRTIIGPTSPIPGIVSMTNPAPASGGAAVESDFDLKYRAAHLPTLLNLETLAWFEALAIKSNVGVLRAVRSTDAAVGVLRALVLRRNGGTFTTSELAAIAAYIDARTRSSSTAEAENVTLTGISVVAQITLDPDATLEDVWVAMADRLAGYLDYRRWTFGALVDESQLLSLATTTQGVATLSSSTFSPAADILIDDDSLPALVNLSLTDTSTGSAINAALTTAF